MTFEAYGKRRVLVTGATGFIGRFLSRLLDAAGAALWLVGRDEEALRSVASSHAGDSRKCLADLSREGEFTRVCRDVEPHVTFNLAGYGVDAGERDEAAYEALNTRLVAEIVDATAKNRADSWTGLRLVHTGSAFEYGTVDGPIAEDSPTNPEGVYGRTKLAGTRLVDEAAALGLPAVVARLFTVYGPGEHASRLLPSLLRAADSGEPLPMTGGKQERDFTYVGEVAEGLLRLGLVRDATGIVNLASGRSTTVAEFARTAAKLIPLRSEQLQLGALPYRGDEVRQGPTNVDRLKGLLGWVPALSISEGIRETIRHEGSRRGA